jgi:hypothetical protein
MVSSAFGASPAVAGNGACTTGVGRCELWFHRRLEVVPADCLVLESAASVLLVQVASHVLPCLVLVAHGPGASASHEVLASWWQRLEAILWMNRKPAELVFLLIDGIARVGSDTAPYVGPVQPEEGDYRRGAFPRDAGRIRFARAADFRRGLFRLWLLNLGVPAWSQEQDRLRLRPS